MSPRNRKATADRNGEERKVEQDKDQEVTPVLSGSIERKADRENLKRLMSKHSTSSDDGDCSPMSRPPAQSQVGGGSVVCCG